MEACIVLVRTEEEHRRLAIILLLVAIVAVVVRTSMFLEHMFFGLGVFCPLTSEQRTEHRDDIERFTHKRVGRSTIYNGSLFTTSW